MPTVIGVRELKNQASRVIRSVREELVEYVITVRDKPVAVLRPVTDEDLQRLQQAELEKALADMKILAQRVATVWESPKSGVELVSDQKR